jgi:hypothetical protein
MVTRYIKPLIEKGKMQMTLPHKPKINSILLQAFKISNV